MTHASWHSQVIAESDATIVVEGNHHFPPHSADPDALTGGTTTRRCFWKGKTEYRNLLIDDEMDRDMAWTHPRPWPLTRRIEGYMAFSPGMAIER
jgi:uncharacterized protein (DUF427 family)